MIAINKFFIFVATVGLFISFILPWKEPYLNGPALLMKFPLIGLIPIFALIMLILGIIRKWFEVTGVITGIITISVMLLTISEINKLIVVGPYLTLCAGLLMLISSAYVLKKKRTTRYYFISDLWLR
ncbi:MAG: hypothetical protein HQM14_19705 [SAR324 cluster bacterium]|nr:hypothetical protein [SAR324 cluster bacterium]